MYSTRGALTVSAMDIRVPEEKDEIIAEAEEAVARIDSPVHAAA